ncbi:ATP-dependent nuclease [Pectobacterium aroidearum]|uniref:ATP-dependent nuclease n=1 Tax=Pectobacterium aroidearum TaxID=1201031 RepID=UPI002A803A24|nr:AAA family ATPase [Pectobacterium aroidearum]MDY4386408.1 AAA family ATPase [Pectobacterium aroidearum]
MQLTKIFISGFKSISTDHPQTISFEKNITTFIGSNGTGKSTVMEALCKLFCVDHSLRGISANDFYNNSEGSENDKNLIIEAWFNFPEPNSGELCIPPLIEHLTFDDVTDELVFRIRLEANLSYELNPLGDIEENVWILNSSDEEPDENDMTKCSSAIRNSIQLSYVPANRDPLIQLKYSSKAVLGRLLKAIEWSDENRELLEDQANILNKLTDTNPAFSEIAQAINKSWNSVYRGRYLSQAQLKFPISNIDEILKLLQLQFDPDELGSKVSVERLSDGQKSLVYFSLIKAMFDIDRNTRKLLSEGKDCNFNHEKMRLPIFNMICLEEPENHLSPHYLGRIISLVKEYGDNDFCQVIVSSHSPSILSRIEPEQIRHFRMDNENRSTVICKLALPDDADEHSKFVKEAVKAYPEIYFSKLVIFGEGDSEEVILPRLLEMHSKNIDANSISVVPLGGRHVNHFWRLLKSLKIPYLTLLDLDVDRNGGGFGRIKYAVEQVVDAGNSTDYIKKSITQYIPAWNSDRNPHKFTMIYKKNSPEEVKKNIIKELENCNVFFSSPLDIDYSMISAFPEIFCVKDEAYGEQGPNKVEIGKEKILIDAVLKSSNTGVRYGFCVDYLNKFLWYRYRFLSNKSKPASHLRMFSLIEDKYSNDEIIEKLPPELIRLLDKVVKLSEETIE